MLPLFDTERLILRPLTLDDAVDLWHVYSDLQTMRYMPSPPHRSIAETRNAIQYDLSSRGAADWVICLKGSDTAVGKINFLGQTRLPGMGYILKRELWGQGLAAEACRPVLAYGFEQRGYDRIELWIDETNGRSQRVAHKLGFRLRGQLPQKYGHEAQHHMMHVYGLWAHEWGGVAAPAVRPRFFQAQHVFYVHDVAQTADFYVNKLGFQLDFLYGDPPDYGAVWRGDWNGGGVSIHFDRVPAETEIRPSGYVIIFVDAQIDALYDTIRANGVEIHRPLQTFPWGMREFMVRDVNGQLLRFGATGF